MATYSATLTGAGDTTIATPTTPSFIAVWGYQVIGKDSDISVTLKTGTTVKATVLCPASGVGGVSCSPGREPYLQGAPGEALKVNLSGSGSVAVNIQYSIM